MMCRSSSKDGLDVQTSISMMDPVIEDVDLRAVEHGHGDELAPRSSPVGLALLRARDKSRTERSRGCSRTEGDHVDT